ncbi:unnamed protein product [Linum trigynum]|uniref:Pentatricopeptide repeat-containing protein n=1 Tax=Linum trigynum TaxID=586398 RepID=A0AAV2C8D2_9ROSI
MYTRCGTISSARQLFDRMPTKDIVAWTSMIDGYGIHGLGLEALNLFHTMPEERSVAPNSITFLSLLSSYSHSGLVREGCTLFVTMKHVQHRTGSRSLHMLGGSPVLDSEDVSPLELDPLGPKHVSGGPL